MCNLSQLQKVLTDTVGDGYLLSIQPGGNYGDYLIYKGFRKLTTELGIDKREFGEGRFRHDGFNKSVPCKNPVSNVKWIMNQLKYLRLSLRTDPEVIYIHGGGNFNDLWGIGVQCYQSAARFFHCPIIVGPQSCTFDSQNIGKIFSSTSNETHFFCREKYSYNLVSDATDKLAHVNVYIDHDTALYLNQGDLINRVHSSDNTLLAFRPDKESRNPTIQTKINPPIKSRDISKAENSFEDFVDAGARANKIFTDRLHAAILGTILDKQVFFYDNAYHKNRGVYEYSLIDKPNIHFNYLY